jgi:hypothetical protein
MELSESGIEARDDYTRITLALHPGYDTGMKKRVITVNDKFQHGYRCVALLHWAYDSRKI